MQLKLHLRSASLMYFSFGSGDVQPRAEVDAQEVDEGMGAAHRAALSKYFRMKFKFCKLAARDAEAAESSFRMFRDWALRKRKLKALRADINVRESE